MNPHRLEPGVDYQRLRQLAEEFTAEWNRLQALYLDAIAGFGLLQGHVECDQHRQRLLLGGSESELSTLQDACSFSYEQILDKGFCTSGIHQATQGQVKARNAPAGENVVKMGQVCLVSFYDFWGDYLRREYVIAKGKLSRAEKNKDAVRAACRQHASHDLWGDIRQLRISIVHHQGVATDDIIRCKLIKWFVPGQPVALLPGHMQMLFVATLRYRNELFKEQFPEFHIEIPPG